MKIALITGSCGLVGAEAAEFFIRKKFKVLGIDNNFRKYFFGSDGSTLWMKNFLKKEYKKKYIHFNTDIRKFKDIEKIFAKYKTFKNGN